MGDRLPVLVAEDQNLKSVVGDCEFEEGASRIFAGGVGVVQQSGYWNVDWLNA